MNVKNIHLLMEELKMDFIPEHGKKLTKEEIKSIIEKNNVHFIRLQC